VIDARAIEQARWEGVEPSASTYSALMFACVRSNDAAMALKLFDQVLGKGMDCDYKPKQVHAAGFFTLVAEQLDNERLRNDGLNILLAVQAHGIEPPQILQDRLIYAWKRKLPEQVLNHFTKLREKGCRLSSAAYRCILADRIGSTCKSGRTCHVWGDVAIRCDDATCDAEEETSAVEEPDLLHTATARAPLRREALTFVPNSWLDPWQIPSETSMLSSWAQYAPSWYDEFLQTGMPQMGSQCDEHTTVMLKNFPCHFLREDLIKEMDAKGFAGLYNYVYVPGDFHTQTSRGFGFVNFISAKELQCFMLAFNVFRGWLGPSWSACGARRARVQGLDDNVRLYRNSAVMGDEVPERFRPVLFDGTERVPFPEPTEELHKVSGSARINAIYQ